MLVKHLVGALSMVGMLVAAPVLAADTTLLKEVPISPATASAAHSRPFTLTVTGRTWKVPAVTVALWFKTRHLDDGSYVLQLRPGAIYDYLNRFVSPQVNDLGEKSRFVLNGGSVQLLSAGRKGAIVDGIKTSLAIRAALVANKTTAAVSMKEYRPPVFSAADFKAMKFPTLLARGDSSFAGSPRNRIHNITVGTARYNGLVLDAGEEFSFNQYLGAVDATNGYLPELVIKDNVTTPEFGGGICQVSTTAFRAAMQAGFPITARHNHSYPVKYYGAPGYDATVYPPTTDLRFVNDTGKPVHVRTAISGTKVIFEFWGTGDGRQVKINGPYVTGKKPDGSLTAAIAQLVSKNGKSVRETNFVSHYQSPAKFPIIRKANGE